MTSTTVASPTRTRLVVALGVLVLLGSMVVAVAVGAGDRDFLDLGIYRDAVSTWWHGDSPYGVAFTDGLQFNYPPSSLVLLVPLDLLPQTLTGVLLVLLGAVLLWSSGRWSLPGAPITGIALTTGLLSMSEPVQMTWRYGQVDLLVVAAVTAALVRPVGRGAAPLLGAAAGLKLLPVTFLLVPALQHRLRTVGLALATTGLLVALALVRAPSMLGDYLDQLVHGAVLIRPADEGHNVSWRGLLGWAVGDHATAAWFLVVLALGAVGLVTLVRAVRLGDRLSAVCVVALLGLLLSPVTWTHHWVWVVLLLGTAIPWWRSDRRIDRAHLIAVLALTAAMVLWLPTWFTDVDHSYRTDGLRWLCAYSYVLLGTVVLVTLALRVRTDAVAARSGP